LDDRGNEFPRINGRHGGQTYRYIYTGHWGDDVAFGPAMKHDVVRGPTEVDDYGRGRITSNSVFVRKPGAAAEDEGWIISYVYDPERDLSDVVILEAQDFAGKPIATIRLPVRAVRLPRRRAPDVNPHRPWHDRVRVGRGDQSNAQGGRHGQRSFGGTRRDRQRAVEHTFDTREGRKWAEPGRISRPPASPSSVPWTLPSWSTGAPAGAIHLTGRRHDPL
jgi:hypothetical protein